jgi:hypothetical protein
MVARGSTTQENPTLWCSGVESWNVSGDVRLYAVGVTSAGSRWTADTTLSKAIETWHGRQRSQARFLKKALSKLRDWDPV